MKVYLFLLVGGHSALLNPVETIKMNSDTQQASKTFPWPKPVNDGGSAFPIADTVHSNGQVQYGSSGMSLRDYFAGQALAGYLSITPTLDNATESVMAHWCYANADAMLAARESKGGAA